MPNPKIKPCPKCGRSGDSLTVYGYDSGTRRVECDGCHYIGPPETSIVKAIRSHNERCNSQQTT